MCGIKALIACKIRQYLENIDKLIDDEFFRAIVCDMLIIRHYVVIIDKVLIIGSWLCKMEFFV
jgi:hypothetical protein